MKAQFREAVEALQAGNLDRARALAESEISTAPSPQAHHLLGIVHCRLGDAAAGLEHLRVAAEAEPKNVGFRIMLMRALVDSGRAAEVLAMAEPAEIRSAAAVEEWRARGEAADAVGDTDESVRTWSTIAAAVPGDWRAWANLGNSYAARGEWEQAADRLSKAATLNPSESTVRRNAAAALSQAHRHDEAIAAFEAARRLGDSSFAVEFGLGQSCLAERRFAEAEAAFQRAHALEPANRDAVFRYGVLLDRNNKTDQLAALLDEALASGIASESLNYLRAVLARRRGQVREAHDLLLHSHADEDPVACNSLRAKLADALGRPAEAFAAAEAMNRAALEAEVPPGERDDWRREAAAYRREQHELARAITPEWGARIPVLPEPPTRKLSFLVGFPRSGTTLLDTFLMGHAQIAVLEEEQLVGQAGRGVKIRDLPSKSLHWVRDARALYMRLLSQLIGRDFTGMVVDKFPLDMAAAPLIHAMFAGSPIIFMQRHPCDVVLSGFMQAFGLVNFGTIEDAADYYDAMMSIWTASKEALPLNTHSVVYEDLVDDPEGTLRPLVGFLGLDWDDHILDHQTTARRRGTIATPSYDQVTEPISRAPRGRWKQYREQMEPVLPLLLSWAERLGYRD